MKKANILVVDDSVLVLLGLNKTLFNNNLNVFLAPDGQKAEQILLKEKIDLVLLDLILPDLSGYEIIDHMKSNEKLKNIPIFVISGSVEADAEKRALDGGVELFLRKPVQPAELIKQIKNILKL